MLSMKTKRQVSTVLAAVASIGLSIVFLLPIVWMLLTSIKPTIDIFSMPPKWIFEPTLEHYTRHFAHADILDRYLNTIIVSIGASILSLMIGTTCGYALARLNIRGGAVLALLILASRTIPPIALVVPFYLLFRRLDMLDKHLTLILTYTTFLVPYVIWLMRGFFISLPRSLEDAALVDGCSRFGAFFRIILPNTLSGITATFIFSIILAWNELMFALVLTSRNAVTIPVSIIGMSGDTEQGALWGPLMAVSTLTVVPVVIFALFVQKWLVQGLASGSTSGAAN
jgi:multiple sugar transport system permease protein